MSEPAPEAPVSPEAERRRIMVARNRAVGLVLLGLVVLFFALSIARIGNRPPPAPAGAARGQGQGQAAH